jgi:hypothetical protein
MLFYGGVVVGEAPKLSPDIKNFYVHVYGDITVQGDALDTWQYSVREGFGVIFSRGGRTKANQSKTVAFSKDIAISKKQFIQFSESPSHMYKFLDDICDPELSPLMDEINVQTILKSDV